MKKWILETFCPAKEEGESKVMELGEAIKRFIKPGMSLLVDHRANAAVRELVRHFNETTPRFTLIASSIANDVIGLLHLRLAEKLICGVTFHRYPSTSPISLIQEAYLKGNLQIENWSLLTLNQRLMAGAMGYPFVTTLSLLGTTTAVENASTFKVIEDPFGSGQIVGIVKPLQPDVALVHGCVSDRYGNAILPPPYEDTIWGPRARKSALILTVEKLVSTEFIRRHSFHMTLPGYLVSAVCEVPFGAHPEGMPDLGINGIVPYKEDYEYVRTYRDASEDRLKLDTHLREWVFGCRDNSEYLEKLGSHRLRNLKIKGKAHAWEKEITTLVSRSFFRSPYSATEMMIVAAARIIQQKFKTKGYSTMLTGIGPAALASWLAYYRLKNQGIWVDMIVGTGELGYVPPPGDPSLLTASFVATCKMLLNGADTYGVIVGGANNSCLSVLGAMQVDKYGNINSTRIGGHYQTGVGGLADAVRSRETILLVRHSPRNLVESLTYITCMGERVSTVVTDMGIFSKLDGQELVLTGYFSADPACSPEAAINLVKAKCGWPLKYVAKLRVVRPPSQRELAIIRLLDPEGFFRS